MNAFSIIAMMCGLAFFLFGMNVMSTNLEKMAGGKLEIMLKRMTANPIISLILGALITIAIQSSSATTVMLVGLVNSGIMQLSQTISVIFGANIGTTLTAWILSLSGIQSDSFWISMLKPENFSPIIAITGVIMMMLAKSDKKKSIGNIFVGFAVLIYGMKLMSDAVSPLADSPQFSLLLTKFSDPFAAVIIGAVFTGIIQSSAASVGILQALSMTGSITFGMAIPIVMGLNIGTCVTSVISCIGANKNAKRVAVVHLLVNIIGTVIWLPVYLIVTAIVNSSVGTVAVTPVTIAVIHTVFNFLATIPLLPFTKQLEHLACLIIKDKKTTGLEHQQDTILDERLLRSPSVAISESNSVTFKMFDIAKGNVKRSMDVLFSEYSRHEIEIINITENEIDKYEDRLGTYLVQISALSLSQSDSRVVSKMLHVIGDFERLGDHAVNLSKAAEEIHDKKLMFTDSAKKELKILSDAIKEILELTYSAYLNNDTELATHVEPLEQVIDRITSQIKHNHINRLREGNCTIEMGFILSDLITNFERISDHCSNIAVAVIETDHDSFDTHKYLNDVKYGNSQFNTVYDNYAEKYLVR